MSTNTGGPAFPGLHPSVECRYNDPGMTLRDYFAAKVMQAFAKNVGCQSDQIWFEDIAKGAYRMADAMLKARQA